MPLFTTQLFSLCSTRLFLQIAVLICCLSVSNAMMFPPFADDPAQAAAGFDKFFLHDKCTAQDPPQPDTCLHGRLHEHSFKFGGKAGAVYDVTLHIRGIFEPTTITGGDTPDPEHPYFKVGGTASTPDWSHWEIEVSEPRQTYWLNTILR